MKKVIKVEKVIELLKNTERGCVDIEWALYEDENGNVSDDAYDLAFGQWREGFWSGIKENYDIVFKNCVMTDGKILSHSDYFGWGNEVVKMEKARIMEEEQRKLVADIDIEGDVSDEDFERLGNTYVSDYELCVK
jgi:hypothetical protein